MNIFEKLRLIGLIGTVLSSIVVYIVFTKRSSFRITIIAFCSFIIFSDIALMSVIRDAFFKSLDEQYYEKLENIENAEKDLQKFLIEHPQFKE